MAIKIQRSKKFKKQFKKLNPSIQKKTIQCLILFAENQSHESLNNHKLKGEYLGCHSINITGDVRAIYEEMVENVYVFIAIGTHHQLYGK